MAEAPMQARGPRSNVQSAPSQDQKGDENGDENGGDGEATLAVETDDEPPFACSLPPGLRSDWPAPRRAVLGSRGGVLAWIEYAALRGALGALARLPLRLRGLVVGGLARSAAILDRRRGEAARVFLRQALGANLTEEDLDARVLQAWRHWIDVTIDTEAFGLHVQPERTREHFDVAMCEDARRVLDEGRGSILATAHVGDWEAGSAVMPWIGFDPFYGVSKPPKNRPLSAHMHWLRERRGVRLLPRRGAMKDAAAVIHGGGMLALILDQRARKRPLMVPFFGRMARCDRSAAVLLKRLHAPVVFAACYRTPSPWRWRLEIPAVVWPKDLEKCSVEEITVRVNRELERLILAAPEQYFWLHDRYRGA